MEKAVRNAKAFLHSEEEVEVTRFKEDTAGKMTEGDGA